MKATVIKAFDGARDGSMYPTHWRPGDGIEGDLARVAVREGWATESAIESTEGADTHIPEGWEAFKAADKVKLARSLGAARSCNTNAGATAYIEAEIAKRAEG